MAQPKSQQPTPKDRLFQLMSEVISLREKMAQAELAAHEFGLPPKQRDETAGPNK
jgi:hypothetical protein